MASIAPLVPEYVYIAVRVKMHVKYNSLISAMVVCNYGDTNDVLLIGGLVLPNETLVDCALRHCSHLAWIHFSRHERRKKKRKIPYKEDM